jgi:hypothetical protein
MNVTVGMYGKMNQVIRYGKMNHVIRYGKMNHVIKYGKMKHVIRYGKTNGRHTCCQRANASTCSAAMSAARDPSSP